MLKYCLKKWDMFNKDLEDALREDENLNSCEYKYLLEKVVEHILNGEVEEFSYDEKWDANKITVIDDGHYQGTLLFVIPRLCYQPCEYEYLMTFVDYGSCSGCDTLQHIQSWFDNEPPTERQLKDYMALCRDMVCNIVRPYNTGWRCDEEFKTVGEE